MKKRRRSGVSSRSASASEMDSGAGRPRDIYPRQLCLLLMLTGAILIALRTPEYWFHPPFYAENGVIFFRVQILSGWSNLFHPYNGYIHSFLG